MADPTRSEMLEFLSTLTCGEPLDECDSEESIYWYAADCHAGQGSNLYAALSESPFSPGICSNGPEPESGAHFFYDALRGCTPRVVLAERLESKAGVSWLVVQFDPERESNIAGQKVMGYAQVAWFPRASFWNCRSALMGRFYGPAALDEALNCAAREESSGPDSSVCCNKRSKSGRPHDTQRAKLYKWERKQRFWIGAASRSTFTDTIQGMCRLLNQREIRIKWTNGKGAKAYSGSWNDLITCGAGMETRAIAVHELAHILTGRWNLVHDTAGHGPEFCATYAALLALEFTGLGTALDEFDRIKDSMEMAGLKVADVPERLAGILSRCERRIAATPSYA